MAQIAPELEQIIERYRRQLEKMGIHAESVMLYGSYAAGLAREGSDIDLIVISKDWETLNRRERMELLGIAAARIMESIQAQGFTPKEVAQRTIQPFWEQIMEAAVAI